MSSSLSERKAELRKEMARRRRQAMEAAPADLAERLCASFESVILPPPAVASGYLPIRSEFDPRPVMNRLAADGWRIGLPVVIAAESPLQFRAYSAGDPLDRGDFGIDVPGEDKEVLSPDLLLVPMLAFDRKGYRLGYGGGFYDRTLSGLRAKAHVLAIGLAYAGQELESVPRDAMDQPLDWIVTEREAISIGAKA